MKPVVSAVMKLVVNETVIEKLDGFFCVALLLLVDCYIACDWWDGCFLQE